MNNNRTSKLLLILFSLIILTSCSKYYIDFMESTDRLIVGYSKNNKRYKVINKYYKKECDIKIFSDTLKPGDILKLKREYNLTY